ncbi:MAG: FMN-binding glutamate synthase family protein [Proteobacteria bacterium]|nr:FMN-binding glutamate synthase family protein [Pseudomonadota bacterium]
MVLIAIYDVFQTKHSITRNYPLIGHIRFIAESLGPYLRAFFYARDREEKPFNRTERSWIYRASKNASAVVSFGTTRNLNEKGSMYFVSSPFPVQEIDAIKTKPITIGPHARNPYTTTSLINISGMSYGSISKNAVIALAKGAKLSGCWMNTGEGGLTEYHLAGGCDLVAQIGTAKYGYRTLDGKLSDECLRKAASYPQVKMFEIKLSQGAKPGRGGLLPAKKVTAEIAAIRGIAPHEDSISPNRFPEINSAEDLLDMINHVREVTGKPTGFKVVLGNYDWLHVLFKLINKRGVESAPDFITLDGKEGGTGAAPISLTDYMGLPLAESLPALVDLLNQYSLRERIKVIASGKLVTPSMVCWALCVGADFVNSARGFLFALGCIQAMRCHTNNCPTGITTHNAFLMRGLDPTDKSVRVGHYVKNLEQEVGEICHSCGVHEPRELTRAHLRMVSAFGTSVAFSELYPDVIPDKSPSTS